MIIISGMVSGFVLVGISMYRLGSKKGSENGNGLLYIAGTAVICISLAYGIVFRS